MKKLLYAIHDDKVGIFHPPIVGDNDASMVRGFGDVVNSGNKESLYCLHPEDFSLWFLGEFDCDNGLFIQDAVTMRKLATGSDFVKA